MRAQRAEDGRERPQGHPGAPARPADRALAAGRTEGGDDGKKERNSTRKGKQGMKVKGRVLGGRLNSAAAAEYLGVTERTLKWMRRARVVAYRKIGRDCVYDVKELDRVLEGSLVRAAVG